MQKYEAKTCDNCQINYHGFSAGMESEGALRIFSRSLTKLQCSDDVQYLGERRFEEFLRVQESNIYCDEFPDLEKLEGIGTSKEDGSKTESPKEQFLKSTKLSDNKPISGRGRLTDAENSSCCQKYYWPSHKKKCWKISRRYATNPSGQYISINCRQM
ncbi:uncharacterized protein TNCV_5140141 [Trichonephila clavipes]|nr:uncharacterized protein TNCV_5140141 [Trichonephila clavipes]